MFQKTLKSFIRDLGRIDDTYKRMYKSPKKYKYITVDSFCNYCNETKEQMVAKEDEWLSCFHSKQKFPIDCSLLNNSHKETIWHHIYTLYISAMKEKHSKITMFLLADGEMDYVYENDTEKDDFIHAQNIYKLLVEKSKNNSTSLPNNLPIPSNIHNLAMDIAKDLQQDKSFQKLATENKNMFESGKPSIDLIMKSMTSNPSIQNLFSTVSNKIQEKIENNEINPEELAQQADGFLKSIDLNPMLKSLQTQLNKK